MADDVLAAFEPWRPWRNYAQQTDMAFSDVLPGTYVNSGQTTFSSAQKISVLLQRRRLGNGDQHTLSKWELMPPQDAMLYASHGAAAPLRRHALRARALTAVPRWRDDTESHVMAAPIVLGVFP